MINPKKAILLVAGQGTRLKPLTETMPKCLVEVNGKAILANALENLARCNVEESILVVGYLKEKIKEKIGEELNGMKITYIDNDLYEQTNNTYSLWLAIKNLHEDLLILEGDVFFEEKLLKEFMKDERENLTIVEKYNPILDGTFVEVREEQKITSWIHKKDRPVGFTPENKYKTVNIHKFSAEFIKKWLKPILKKHIEETGGEEPIEFIFSELIKNKAKIYAFNIQGIPWIEIDDAHDLKRAEEIFK
ncbi:MAG: phosphocholine cytidylyltransferase family protein [Caldisericia bacterium]|nr:phosphocholine cytidylyltransferase family protein [Caldisericia bacterium]